MPEIQLHKFTRFVLIGKGAFVVILCLNERAVNKFKSNLLIIFKDVYMLWNDSAYYKRIIH